jgi:hypothetical protein
MLESLRAFYDQQGLLSGIIIDECEGCPPAAPTAPGLAACCAPTAWSASRRIAITATSRSTALRGCIPIFFARCSTACRRRAAMPGRISETDRVIVNDEFSLSVVIVRCTPTPTGLLRWKMRFDTSLMPDITIVVRMDSAQPRAVRLLSVPAARHALRTLRLAEDNDLQLDAYRFDGLDFSTTSPRPSELRRLPDARHPSPDRSR